MSSGIDEILRSGRALRPVGVIILIALAVPLSLALGCKMALAYALAGQAADGLRMVAERTPQLRVRRPRAWQALFVASYFAVSAVWTGAAVSLWLTGDLAYQTAALVLLWSLVLSATEMTAHVKTIAVVFAAGPVAAMIALPSFFSAYSGKQLLLLGSLTGICLLMLAKIGQEAARQAKALREANARLQDQEADLVRKADEAMRANESKSRFLAMVSHEVRTPMNGVLGLARALRQSRLTRQQGQTAQMLVRSSESLMEILNDLLDLSKIEAGKLDLEVVAFEMQDVAERVRELWTETASAKGVQLVVDVALPRPLWVFGDPTRLRQILLNLVSNALKFTETGDVRLSITLEDDAADAATLRFQVSDTGIGLSAEQCSRLFQPYVQAEQSTARRFGGTGLGLSICQQLADLMGASIAVESRLGHGSRFHFSLRLPHAEPPSEAEGVDGVALEGLQVLVADDNPVNLAVAQAILEAAGAVAVTVPDGQAALEALRGAQFDVVLLDVHMPVMGGLEALRHIRAGEAGRRDIPVIALTADAMVGVDDGLREKGFDAVQPKPVVPSKLLAEIAHAVARAALPVIPASTARSA